MFYKLTILNTLFAPLHTIFIYYIILISEYILYLQLNILKQFYIFAKKIVMKHILIVTLLFVFVATIFAQSDYYIKKSQEYQREAEYYQKKANDYRREAEYYLRKAEDYQREAAYYTKRGDVDRAKIYSRYAENEMDKYETKIRYAADADDKAAMYLRWAADALRK